MPRFTLTLTGAGFTTLFISIFVSGVALGWLLS